MAARAPDDDRGSNGPVVLWDLAGLPGQELVQQLPEGQYDVQIESAPPGDYLFTAVVSLEEFMALLRAVSGPKNTWPASPGLTHADIGI
jgi:hypothetical protein